VKFWNTARQAERWYAYGIRSNDVLNQTDVATGTRGALLPDILGSYSFLLEALFLPVEQQRSLDSGRA